MLDYILVFTTPVDRAAPGYLNTTNEEAKMQNQRIFQGKKEARKNITGQMESTTDGRTLLVLIFIHLQLLQVGSILKWTGYFSCTCAENRSTER